MTVVYGEETPKLGFGMMRLPRKGIVLDLEQIKTMVDMFMEAGFTYYDTAFVYPGSEAVTRKALVERYPRDSFTLATKLHTLIAPTAKAARREFTTSLRRLGVKYVDYYLLHSLMESNVGKYERFQLWDFVNEQKAKGKIRNLGFSFHGGPKLLDQLLTEHPEVDFVQLQLNYADWENKKITSRANYEVARKHDKLIVVMEPVKGGKLTKPPKEVQKLFKSIHPEMSCASWAIRFVASLEGILTVLSGMSNIEQMQDNLASMKDFKPLNAEEQEAIRKAQRIIGKSAAIPCTACKYCVKGCPKKIRIPEVFEAMNLQLGNGQMEEAREAYRSAAPKGHKASDCIRCGKCEEACPQHLAIREYLQQAKTMFEEE